MGLPFDWHLIPVSLHEQQIDDSQRPVQQGGAVDHQGEITEQSNSDFADAESLEEGRQDQRRLLLNSENRGNVFRSLSLVDMIWRRLETRSDGNQPGLGNNWWIAVSQWFSSWMERLWKNLDQTTSDSH